MSMVVGNSVKEALNINK